MIHTRSILFVLGFILGVLGLAMLVPAAVDWSAGNADWQVFVAASAATAFTGVLFLLGTVEAERPRMGLRDAFLLTTLLWATVSAFAALPFVGLGFSITDAYFEAVSGLTTTGSTVFTGLDAMPPGILLWRSFMQWIGGIGIIAMALIMLPFLRVGGMQLFQTESSDTTQRVLPRTGQVMAWIAATYLILTAACAAAYRIGGMSAFDALCHAMTTVSTGGYSTHDASFAYFEDSWTQWAATLFMLAGALPFATYIRTVRVDRRAIYRDPQAQLLVALLAASSLVLAGWLIWSADAPFSDAFRLAAFNVTSVVTTTGYATADYGTWGGFAMVAFMLLMFVGGATGSTAGAIKIYRFQILWIIMRRQMMRLLTPHRVIVPHYAGQAVSEEIFDSVLAFLTLFIGSTMFLALALSLMGLDFVTASTSAITAVTNVGPGLGDTVGPAGNFSTLPDIAKWLLAIGMLIGRLEVFTVLVLLTPHFWRP